MDVFKSLEKLKEHYHVGQIIEQEENRIIWYEYISSKNHKSAILTQNTIEIYDSNGVLIEEITVNESDMP